MSSRRIFLKLTAAALIPGCIGDGGDPPPSPSRDYSDWMLIPQSLDSYRFNKFDLEKLGSDPVNEGIVEVSDRLNLPSILKNLDEPETLDTVDTGTGKYVHVTGKFDRDFVNLPQPESTYKGYGIHYREGYVFGVRKNDLVLYMGGSPTSALKNFVDTGVGDSFTVKRKDKDLRLLINNLGKGDYISGSILNPGYRVSNTLGSGAKALGSTVKVTDSASKIKNIFVYDSGDNIDRDKIADLTRQRFSTKNAGEITTEGRILIQELSLETSLVKTLI